MEDKKFKSLVMDAVSLICLEFLALDDFPNIVKTATIQIKFKSPNKFRTNRVIASSRNSEIWINKKKWPRLNQKEQFYVLIHEIAHSLDDSVGPHHGAPWRKLMKRFGFKNAKAYLNIRREKNSWKTKKEFMRSALEAHT